MLKAKPLLELMVAILKVLFIQKMTLLCGYLPVLISTVFVSKLILSTVSARSARPAFDVWLLSRLETEPVKTLYFDKMEKQHSYLFERTNTVFTFTYPVQ